MSNVSKSIPLAGFAAILFAASAAAQNLIVNGDFELGTASGQNQPAGSTAITGWTIGGTSVDYAVGTSYWPGNSSRWVDLTGAGSLSGNAWLQQSFATEIGATYTATFTVFNGSLVWSEIGAVSGPVLSVSATGSTPQSISVNAGAQATVAVTFVATATTTTLRFTEITGRDTNAAWIDNVSVIKAAAAPVADYPAAPAIAAHYLQMLGLKPSSSTYKNYVSLVANHMTKEAKFEGLAPSAPGYAQAVTDWMVAQFGLPAH